MISCKMSDILILRLFYDSLYALEKKKKVTRGEGGGSYFNGFFV